MSDKLDRFTRHARHTLAMAQESALRFNLDEIKPEHLLIALDLEKEGLAGALLQEAGIASGQIRRTIEHAVVQGEGQLSGAPQLADPTKRVIVLAVEEVARMGSPRITTAHLLLGILRQEEGTAFEVLQALGIHYDEVHRLAQQTMQRREIPEVQEIPLAGTENGEDGESSGPPPSSPS